MDVDSASTVDLARKALSDQWNGDLPTAARAHIADSAGVEILDNDAIDYARGWNGAGDTDIALSPVLPLTPDGKGDVGFVDVSTGSSIAIGLSGADALERQDGVATVRDTDREVAAVSHVTDTGFAQIVAIADASIDYVDFVVQLPAGASLQRASDGSMNIESAHGQIEGKVDVPWAFDEDGNAVPTRFEVMSDGTLRQHFSAKSDAGRVILDPSFLWWAGTSANCAASLAITFTPIKLVKLTKSITSIAKKSATIAKAVDRLGGAYKAAVKTVQHNANRLKEKAGSAVWGKAIPSFKLTAQQKADAARITGFVGGNIWEFIGLGSCGAIFDELF